MPHAVVWCMVCLAVGGNFIFFIHFNCGRDEAS